MATGAELAKVGFKYLGVPYSTMDCQAFVEKCLSDVGIRKDLAGSNTWYRFLMQNGWVGTPEECKAKFGSIPVGSFLFIWKNNGGEPEKYRKDGIGNADHIGIYTATGLGAINSSSTNKCVCESKFAGKSINGGWNRVGLWKIIDYGERINKILSGESSGGSSGGGGSKMSYQAKVVGGGLNLRTKKNKKSDLIIQIPDGSIVTVFDDDGEWSKVSFDGNVGYSMSQYLEKIDGDSDTVAVPRKKLQELYDQIVDWLGLRG